MLDRLLRSNYNTGNSVDLEDEEVIFCSNVTFGVLCALCELDKYHRARIKKGAFAKIQMSKSCYCMI